MYKNLQLVFMWLPELSGFSPGLSCPEKMACLCCLELLKYENVPFLCSLKNKPTSTQCSVENFLTLGGLLKFYFLSTPVGKKIADLPHFGLVNSEMPVNHKRGEKVSRTTVFLARLNVESRTFGRIF